MERYYHVNSTRRKNRILAHFPDLAAHKERYDALLAFNKDLGAALRVSLDQNHDDESIFLVRAANIVRKDMLKWQASFSGSFDLDSQTKSVPHSFSALAAIILNGTNIKSQGCDGASQATFSIAQLLQYISVHRRPESTGTYHLSARETLLPMYLGLMVHARTRKRDLIETVHFLLDISTTIGNHVCNHYHQSQVVCPPNLCESLFTTAAIDNIDQNPTSTTATDALHGTGISLFQHPNSYGGHEHREHPTLVQKSTSKKLSDLPQSYTTVCPLMPMKKDTTISKLTVP